MDCANLLLSALTLAVGLALPAAAQNAAVVKESVPGAVGVAQTVEVTATITAIDAASRAVTLKGPQGREMTVIAGPEVKNFAQLHAGDKVGLRYVEALVVELHKGGGKAVARTEQMAGGSAAPGQAPGAAGGRRVSVVGDVIGLDPATQTVTVKGPQRTVDLKVRDPEQFKLIALGDQLEATYTEAMAVAVSPMK